MFGKETDFSNRLWVEVFILKLDLSDALEKADSIYFKNEIRESTQKYKCDLSCDTGNCNQC